MFVFLERVSQRQVLLRVSRINMEAGCMLSLGGGVFWRQKRPPKRLRPAEAGREKSQRGARKFSAPGVDV